MRQPPMLPCADKWLLFAMESPVAARARGLNRGLFFRRDGTLVATVVQEGLMRIRSD
ncbi:acyl-CoA thioesterase [Rhodothermus profundi]|uniref:acyl-CoA thioesterase n=1 Tax=Rhodothermus profundi TaxID=633813 RepID=UPI000A040CF0|nr:acyl-CoA thioesterase domain-containing protein [Rhodothermus profundi]